ncbi:MAG: M28 family metallopeptidase [Burkholderiales bacterium]|nr:M28 family metallopeptidase [Burkholderiales bacterium]
MRHLPLVLSCFTALAAMSASAQPAQPAPDKPAPPSPLIQKIAGEISAQRIEANIRKLAGFGTRNTLSDTKSDTRGIGAARRWIKSELDKCAKESGGRLQVAFDEYLAPVSRRIPQPTPIVNVVATLPGTQPAAKDRLYVVSGHYDSMPSSPTDPEMDAPGANDDASGTAAVMELACVMAKYEFDATLVFMTVAGEEQGLIGARFWAERAKAQGVNVAGMITNDIIGNTKGFDGTVVKNRVRLFAEGVPAVKELPEEVLAALRTGGENDLPTRQLARYIKEAGERHVPNMKVDLIYRRDRYLRGGDHIPFLESGYPAVRFTEPNENWRHQHQNVRIEEGVQLGDLPDFVDFEYTANVTRVNAAALASLALGPAAPQNVEMENLRLENNTTLRWKAAPDADVAGYRIVWRETTSPFWQWAQDVGNVTRETIIGVSKDNFQFGVQAYDKAGHRSVVAYPKPYRP